MAHTKSAKKRAKTSEKSRISNKSTRMDLKGKRREFLAAVSAKNLEAAEKALRTYSSALDRAAKTGVLKKNNSIRHKARARAMLAKTK